MITLTLIYGTKMKVNTMVLEKRYEIFYTAIFNVDIYYLGTHSTFFVDLGVFLPKLCEAQGANTRREMSEIKSSGHVAPGPVQPGKLTGAPGPVLPVEFTIAPIVAPAPY